MHAGIPPPLWEQAPKLGQGYIFTGVCDSVQRGESASVHAGIPSPPPWGQAPPSQTRHPREQAPPGAQHAGRYGQRAGSTHPTGMQSYFSKCWEFIARSTQKIILCEGRFIHSNPENFEIFIIFSGFFLIFIWINPTWCGLNLTSRKVTSCKPT